MKIKLFILSFAFCLLYFNNGYSQLILLGSFNPPGVSTLCGIAYDPDSAHVWVYGCNSDSIQCFDTTGTLLNTVAVAGGSANDVDVEIAPVQFIMNGQTIPKGQLLLINGEVDSAEIYAIDNISGIVIDTLFTAFGNDHVVGGSYHPIRNTFFMIQDNLPGAALENLIAEISPVTGDTIQTFQITNYMDVFYGDIEVGQNGHLFVVSSDIDSVGEFTPQGSFIQKHMLPAGVTGLSGIALDCANGQAWVSGNSGTVFRLGNVPCNTSGISENPKQPFFLSNVSPNPFRSEISFSVVVKNQGPLKITLSNITGEIHKLIYNGLTPAGILNFSIAETTLTNGVYFLKVEGTSYFECRRMIYIK